MDADTLDLILRSRPTILEVLENRGYNVDSYKNVSPAEIKKFASTNTGLLKITAEKRPDGPAPSERIIVLYWMDPVRLRIETEIAKLWDDSTGNEAYNPATDEVLIMLNETENPAFDVQVAKQWVLHKARVSFFQLKHLINNPAKHSFVFPHRKLSAEECDYVIKTLHLKSRSELPRIIYHVDMQARILGLVPGDIVEISRSSETAGIYKVYRLCSV